MPDWYCLMQYCPPSYGFATFLPAFHRRFFPSRFPKRPLQHRVQGQWKERGSRNKGLSAGSWRQSRRWLLGPAAPSSELSTGAAAATSHSASCYDLPCSKKRWHPPGSPPRGCALAVAAAPAGSRKHCHAFAEDVEALWCISMPPSYRLVRHMHAIARRILPCNWPARNSCLDPAVPAWPALPARPLSNFRSVDDTTALPVCRRLRTTRQRSTHLMSLYNI